MKIPVPYTKVVGQGVESRFAPLREAGGGTAFPKEHATGVFENLIHQDYSRYTSTYLLKIYNVLQKFLTPLRFHLPPTEEKVGGAENLRLTERSAQHDISSLVPKVRDMKGTYL